MFVWFSLFVDLDLLLNFDVVGKISDDMIDA